MAKSKKWAKFSEQMKRTANWLKVATEILNIQFADDPTNKKGWVRCYSVDGSDQNPSASFNLSSGFYKDFRDGRKAVSPYDLMVELRKATNFGEARKKLADMFGVKYPEISEDDPEYGVKWIPWNDVIAQRFCDAKPGITVEGLKKAGTQMCSRHHVSCIALPITGGGWMFMPSNGKPFPKSEAKSISKMPFGVEPGLLMEQEIETWIDNKPVTVYWCEGGPDFLAALSANKDPMRTFVTNPHGCAQKCNITQRTLIDDGIDWVPIRVICDLDIPGVMGGWNKLDDNWHKDAQILRPAGEIDKKHGKDLRDVIVEFENDLDKALEQFVRVSQPDIEFCTANSDRAVKAAAAGEELSPADLYDEDSEQVISGTRKKEEIAEATMARVGISIPYVEPGGEVNIKVKDTGMVREIKDISYTRFETWCQIAGVRFATYVVRTAKEAALANDRDEQCISFDTFKERISIMAYKKSALGSIKLGVGIWPGRDKDGVITNDVIISQRQSCYRWDGENLEKLEDSVFGSILYSAANDCPNWFDDEEMVDFVNKAKDPAFRQCAYAELSSICNQWNWRHKDMGEITAGCFLASIIQATLDWRPTISIIGESNAGKSSLHKFGEYMFGLLGAVQSQSSAAGVMQSIGRHSKILMIDEIDSGNQRDLDKLLKQIRSSSRGQSIMMGTAHHKSIEYRICHIPWLMGIRLGADEQPDMNRMIILDMLKSEHERVTIGFNKPETQRHARNLGKRLIACMVVCAMQTRENFKTILDAEVPSNLKRLSTRYRESYATVYGAIAAMNDLDTDEVMHQYWATLLRVAEETGLEAEDEHDQIMRAVLSCEVRIGNKTSAPEEVASIAEILFDPRFEAHRDAGRHKGIGHVVRKRGGGAKVTISRKKLSEYNGLLKGTSWNGKKGLDGEIMRIKFLEFKKDKQLMGGVSTNCLSTDYDKLKEWAASQKVIDSDGNMIWKHSGDLEDSEEGPDGRLIDVETLEIDAGEGSDDEVVISDAELEIA